MTRLKYTSESIEKAWREMREEIEAEEAETAAIRAAYEEGLLS